MQFFSRKNHLRLLGRFPVRHHSESRSAPRVSGNSCLVLLNFCGEISFSGGNILSFDGNLRLQVATCVSCSSRPQCLVRRDLRPEPGLEGACVPSLFASGLSPRPMCNAGFLPLRRRETGVGMRNAKFRAVLLVCLQWATVPSAIQSESLPNYTFHTVGRPSQLFTVPDTTPRKLHRRPHGLANERTSRVVFDSSAGLRTSPFSCHRATNTSDDDRVLLLFSSRKLMSGGLSVGKFAARCCCQASRQGCAVFTRYLLYVHAHPILSVSLI